MKTICLFLVRTYQVLLGPFLGGACRFYPSCSHYACEAIQLHGARRGSWLALRRLLRCHPFSPGGVDLVPEAPANDSSAAAARRRTAASHSAKEEFAR
jgi:putative membrane protein insertion efficiency factor